MNTENGTHQLPEFACATPGSVLDRLDHMRADLEADAESRAASARGLVEARAQAMLRGEPDPYPSSDQPTAVESEAEPDEDGDFDLGTIAGICAAKRRGLLPERFNQTRRQYDEAVVAFKAGRLTDRGRWSTPRVVAAARIRTRSTQSLATRRESRCSRRRSTRRSAQRSRAASGGSAGSEPGPDPDGGSGARFTDDDALLAAASIAAGFPRGLTRVQFWAAVEPFVADLDLGVVGNARARVFAVLAPALRQAVWAWLRLELDDERAGRRASARRCGAGNGTAPLPQSETNGGAR